MELKYKQYGTGKKKILFSDGSYGLDGVDILDINKNNDYSIYFLDKSEFLPFFKHDILGNISLKKLNKTYNKNKGLKGYYNKIIDFCISQKIDHIIFTHTGQYRHPEFLQRLKKLGISIALFTADDDSPRINYCSLPYTKYYDYHFHVGVMYDKNGKTIADKLKEYGGNPVRIPLGARGDHISKDLEIERDIDICYIGNVNPRKILRLSKLKKHFGDRIKLFGGQGNGDWKSLKGICYKLANKIFRLGYIEPISDEKLVDIYRRTKIGFNMHLIPRKGPSNSRMYELPCNQVMQLCDNILGLSKIFILQHEIVGYSDINDAIQKIEYYLQHEDERIKIAKAGYNRAIKKYTLEKSYERMMNILYGNIE